MARVAFETTIPVFEQAKTIPLPSTVSQTRYLIIQRYAG
jgi:hypothetical protein